MWVQYRIQILTGPIQQLNTQHWLIFDQSVYVVLRPMFAGRHFEHVRNTQQRLLSVFVRDNLTPVNKHIVATQIPKKAKCGTALQP